MKIKKQRYIRKGIVFDPNIDFDPFDDDGGAKKRYFKGKGKRKKYFGI